MSKNIKTQVGKVVGKSLDAYYKKMKPTIDELKYKEEYQGRIIDCMVGEIDDNYIETPETDAPVVKLEHSREGVVKIPSIKGKTILIDADGNETDTPREGCRLVSVGEEEDNKLIILSKNKNMIDFGEYAEIVPDGIKVNYTDIMSNKIKLLQGQFKPNTQYVFKCKAKELTQQNKNPRIRFVYTDGSMANTSAMNSVDFSEIMFRSYEDKTIDHITFTASSWGGELILKDCILIEGSNFPTEYIEPKQHKTEILLDEPLRKIDNIAYDEIIDSKIIRRVGRVILDGTEEWITWRDNSKTHNNCYVYINNTHNGLDLKASRNNRIKSNILEKKMIYLQSNKGIFFANDQYLAIGVPIEELGIDDTSDYRTNVNAIKKWLSENNVEVLYELAEPIIEELPNGITLQGYDDTTMYIENSITPTIQYGYNALIPYKQELLNQQEEVETNTLDIENNIIPYLMDMEFNLMLMEDN